MLPLPWKTLAAPDSNREYLALLSFLPLKHYRMIPKFLWLTFETQRQLRNSKGLIGYSLHAQPLRRRFWTLSVWADQQSLPSGLYDLPALVHSGCFIRCQLGPMDIEFSLLSLQRDY